MPCEETVTHTETQLLTPLTLDAMFCIYHNELLIKATMRYREYGSEIYKNTCFLVLILGILSAPDFKYINILHISSHGRSLRQQSGKQPTNAVNTATTESV